SNASNASNGSNGSNYCSSISAGGSAGTASKGAKRSATSGLGEREKRVHKNPTQLDALTNTLGQALEMMKPPPIDRCSATLFKLPESVQLTMVVAKKLNDLLMRYNGEYEGEYCSWLHPRMTYKFGKVLADPHNAAMFLGTDSDEALVELLKDLQDEF
ncbi:hypothetical protein BDR26DRAFT_857538, partial [Obelidium mucronatum]